MAYARGPDLVVEWYDFGEAAPYESANLLIFGAEAQAALARRLALEPLPSTDALAQAVAGRFGSYFAVRAFADAEGIAYRHAVDFSP
ncbi:hypothetical protein [Phenylobacterium sp.]|uniref:hypothetical protein n=1 Tax=Phenylobacterium sp. TaxID=1871053 RepID=UPI002F416FF4